MAVTECTIGTHTITVDVAEYELEASESPDMAGIVTTAVSQLRALAALCNAADFDAATNHLPVEERRIYGDATDQAILRFSERLGSVHHMRQCWQKTSELAFNSKNKFMMRTFSLFKNDCLPQTLPQGEVHTFNPGDT
jgi:sodium/potassium-transporting ATPase subunit alpha